MEWLENFLVSWTGQHQPCLAGYYTILPSKPASPCQTLDLWNRAHSSLLTAACLQCSTVPGVPAPARDLDQALFRAISSINKIMLCMRTPFPAF
ncbi:hypothetical protein PoB_000304300 [Plakobranchus ocellatus]|uniref:Uncharacterized protein n=1 Tax=Plakobranchus ocellatus TaxID=259542 RepID=A0AAV3Y2R1_9GAST|nr:hypothetical protein PoB_000304300 [Plakobranchus ocellatus]